MKTDQLQSFSKILEIIWALPIIGVLIIIHPILPIAMIVIHSIIIIQSLNNNLQKTGNIIGLVGSVFSLIASSQYDVYHTGLEGAMVPLLLSWPLHIASAKVISDNLKDNIRMQKTMLLKKKKARMEREQQAKEEAQRKLEKKRFERAGKDLLSYYHAGYVLSIDTNMLIDGLTSALIYSFVEKHHATLYVSVIVLDELDGLKNDEKELGKLARDAIRFLEYY